MRVIISARNGTLSPTHRAGGARTVTISAPPRRRRGGLGLVEPAA